MMEKFIGKKEKWTNKGTDKQYVADSLIHRGYSNYFVEYGFYFIE